MNLINIERRMMDIVSTKIDFVILWVDGFNLKKLNINN